MAGHTLLEISIAMGVSALLATGFFQAFRGLSVNVSQQVIVSNYQDGVRQALYQVARDLRLAGANPTAHPDLFDHVPAADMAVDIDPDGDGDITNAILVRADKQGTSDGEADGDIEDSLEAVMYHYDKPNARLMRHVWWVEPSASGTETQPHTTDPGAYDAIPFQEGICDFMLRYFDYLDNPTTVADDVATVVIEMSTASGPGECHSANSFTRFAYAIVRIRNR
jgi:hypothetical protein